MYMSVVVALALTRRREDAGPDMLTEWDAAKREARVSIWLFGRDSATTVAMVSYRSGFAHDRARDTHLMFTTIIESAVWSVRSSTVQDRPYLRAVRSLAARMTRR